MGVPTKAMIWLICSTIIMDQALAWAKEPAKVSGRITARENILTQDLAASAR